MYTGLDEYPVAFKEGAETPTVLSASGTLLRRLCRETQRYI